MQINDVELETLAKQVGEHLQAVGGVLATAESCTGGWVGEVLTSVPGSSQWYVGGFITYANAAKQGWLGVNADTLIQHGAVSEAVAAEMALGALARSDATLALSISGVAGPGGGTEAKPVGMVCLAWAERGGMVLTTTCRFDGDRRAIRARAVAAALRGVIEIVR